MCKAHYRYFASFSFHSYMNCLFLFAFSQSYEWDWVWGAWCWGDNCRAKPPLLGVTRLTQGASGCWKLPHLRCDLYKYCILQGLLRLIKRGFVRPRYCHRKLTGEGYFVVLRGKESLCLRKEFLCAKSGHSAFITNKKGMWTDSVGRYQRCLLLNSQ